MTSSGVVVNVLFRCRQGEQWQRQRQVLAGELLSRDMVSQLTAPIASVTDDFISRLRDVRESGGDRAVVDQLTSYVHRWTLEGKTLPRTIDSLFTSTN